MSLSIRCCDEKECLCACRYKCGTWESKQQEFKKRGYKECVRVRVPPHKHAGRLQRKTNELAIVAEKKCQVTCSSFQGYVIFLIINEFHIVFPTSLFMFQEKKNELNCRRVNKSFICMRKIIYVRRQHQALICFNTRCVKENERKVIKLAANRESQLSKKGSSNYGGLCTHTVSKIDVSKRHR